MLVLGYYTEDNGITDSIDIQAEAVQPSGGQDDDVGLPAIDRDASMLLLNALDKVIRGAAQPEAHLEMERNALCRQRRIQLSRQCNRVSRGEINFCLGQLNHIVQAILRVCAENRHWRLAGDERIVAARDRWGLFFLRLQALEIPAMHGNPPMITQSALPPDSRPAYAYTSTTGP